MHMNKQQRLRNTADGFLAGLVLAGFESHFSWAHHQWEGPFYSAWNRWPPKSRTPSNFPSFALGGSADGHTSQARDMMFTVKSTSPFVNYRTESLVQALGDYSPAEWIDLHLRGDATPAEWGQLAAAFLDVMEERGLVGAAD